MVKPINKLVYFSFVTIQFIHYLSLETILSLFTSIILIVVLKVTVSNCFKIFIFKYITKRISLLGVSFLLEIAIFILLQCHPQSTYHMEISYYAFFGKIYSWIHDVNLFTISTFFIRRVERNRIIQDVKPPKGKHFSNKKQGKVWMKNTVTHTLIYLFSVSG